MASVTLRVTAPTVSDYTVRVDGTLITITFTSDVGKSEYRLHTEDMNPMIREAVIAALEAKEPILPMIDILTTETWNDQRAKDFYE